MEEVVELILRNPKFDLTANGYDLFVEAMISGYLPYMKLLLENSQLDPSDYATLIRYAKELDREQDANLIREYSENMRKSRYNLRERKKIKYF
jgi:hypothetical protein